jgi:predicted acyl esterase
MRAGSQAWKENRNMDAIIGTGKLSKRQYGITVERNVSIPVGDGIVIDSDVFRPRSGDKFPALISISPYSKELQSARIWPRGMSTSIVHGCGDGVIEAGPTDFFVRRGYVHVIASTRGTGKSGGAYRFMDNRETRDIYDVIEWAAGQPWCNGNVGMLGTSYFAWSQQQTAALQPPHLKAICPFFACTDQYRDAWYHGGIISSRFANVFFSTGATNVHTAANISREEMSEDEYYQAVARALADRDLSSDPEFIASLQNPRLTENVTKVDVLLHPTDSPYWKERSVSDFDKVKIPAYLGCSWDMYSLHLPGTFRSWSNLKVPKKMVIGPPVYLDRPVYQYQWEILRWYDYWLKGIDTGILEEPKVRLFITGENEWKTAEDWPVPGTRWIPFSLHSGGILSELEPWPDASAATYWDAPGKRGSLKYASPALVENTEVVGPIALNLFSSSRGTEIHFFASLWDSDPQGNETLLTRGYLKGSHRELDPEKSRPWQPFHIHTSPEPLVPGEIYEFAVEIMPTGHLFKVGHRICLKISGDIDEAPKTGAEALHEGHLSSQLSNRVTIYHDADHPSHLLLPITRGNIVGTYLSGGDISIREPRMD